LFNKNNYDKAKIFFHKHGKKSIFIGRFAGPISCIFPFLSGSLKVKYSDFLKYNVPAVIIGISQFLIAGYLFGISYSLFLANLKKYIFYIIVIGIIILYILYKSIKKLKKKKDLLLQKT
jgi:membrane protein DedA with SNARE-associated domain